MFTVYGQPPSFCNLNSQYLVSSAELISRLEGAWRKLSFEPEQRLFDAAACAGFLYVISSGFVALLHDNLVTVHYEQGEILGEHLLPAENAHFVADSPVTLLQIPLDDLRSRCRKDVGLAALWETHLNLSLRMFSSLLSHVVATEYPIRPETHFIRPGDPIIIQETSPTDVYQMLHGTADVYIGEIQVGQVHSGEIFGAMAFVTETPRSASVIACTSCLVVKLNENEFMTLLRSHPTTVKKLISSLCGIIGTQNKKIVEMMN